MSRSYRLGGGGGASGGSSGAGSARVRRRSAAWLLYSGVVLAAALAAFTFLSLRREWQRRIGESRGQTIFELVQDTVPSRPTETPGVVAWLHLELKRYARTIADPKKARLYGSITDWHDESSLPSFLTDLRAALSVGRGLPTQPGSSAAPATGEVAGPTMHTPAGAIGPTAQAAGAAGSAADLGASRGPDEAWRGAGGSDVPQAIGEAQLAGLPATEGGMGDGGGLPLELRVQRYLELRGRWFAMTRRRSADVADVSDESVPSNRFLRVATRRLILAEDALGGGLAARPWPAVPGDRPPRLVRLYAVSEDGTLVSAPVAADPGSLASRRAAALGEGREFRKLPQLPSFVPAEFLFRFDWSAPGWQARAYYSGLYLDLGGQGVVATLLVPMRDAAAGVQGVMCADVVYDIDWRALAAHVEPPMTAEVVQLEAPVQAPWRPWAAMAAHGAAGVGADLRGAVASLAAAEGRSGRALSPFYLYHGTVEGQGALAAIQVAATRWLVILFPVTRSSFALLPAVLLGLLVVLLLAGFEASRRRIERAQWKAERELQEKQNLLNTMQVPLMVVDPNTDEVVYGNLAAASLGITGGTRAGDLVADEPGARRHYAQMQVSEAGTRRAYGVPLRVRGERGEIETRYAIVRSVAVTAPIDALRADERHRLAVLFLVEPEVDLALWRDGVESGARADERRKLAGLLTHGVDSLARVLAHSLEGRGGLGVERTGGGAAMAFERWLATYIERRILATAWLLEHWDGVPPLPPDSAVEAAQARATVDSWRRILARVRQDARLRSRLHWDNGALAAPLPAGETELAAAIDWPDDHWFALPLRGAFGFFLGEVLANAVRHGRPGTTPALTLTLDPVRRELLCEVTNAVPDVAAPCATAVAPADTAAAAPAAPAAAAPVGTPGVDRYGGRRILERLAHLCDWHDLRFGREAACFRVTWRIPVSRRGDPAGAD